MKSTVLYYSKLISLIQMLSGTILSAAAFGLIIIPRGFAAAGVTGFSTTLTAITPIPLSVMVLIINILLLGLGIVFIGKSFLVKTVAVSVLFPVIMEMFLRLNISSNGQNDLLWALAAGVLLGFGAGLILRSGASSGGFDVIAVILNRKFRISVGLVMNICDAGIILMQAMKHPLSRTIYGILVITISAFVVNTVVNFSTSSLSLLKKYQFESK